MRAKSSFYENLKQKVKQWNTNTDYIGAGTLGCAFSSHFKIFSPLTQAKSLLLNTEFLKILYGAEELALQPLITDEINELREDALHKTDMPTITNKNNNYREDRLYSTTKNNKRGIESSVNDTMNTETNKGNLTKEDKIISGVLSDMEHRDLDARNAFTEREISHIFKKANGDEIYEKYIRMNTEMIYERAETLGDEKYVGTMQYFYFLVGQLMMSAYLQNVLSDIQTFYTEIVGLFDHARFYDLKVIKMVVVPLKRIFSELELDAEELDRILNKIVYAYIAKLFKDKPISEFPSAIEESKSLLNAVAQYFSEFDEMLEREIDKILVAHYDNNTGTGLAHFDLLTVNYAL